MQNVTWKVGDRVDTATLPVGEALNDVVLRAPSLTLRNAPADRDLGDQELTVEAYTGALTAAQVLAAVAQLLCSAAQASEDCQATAGRESDVDHCNARNAGAGVCVEGGSASADCAAMHIGNGKPDAASDFADISQQEGGVLVLDGLRRVSAAGRLPVAYEVQLIR